ncbi:hypothetical protein KKB43_04920 [Patescibacteria group bacterium]|nr:hypothetical protein [Patescibacteria group bacterium]MBU4580327.1 hypothetical protein [Patescibacteria group bacterium]
MFTLESIKQFLKPDLRKIVFIVVFFFLATGGSGVDIKENNNILGPTGVYFKEHGFPTKWLKVQYGAGGGEKITSYSNLL